MAISKVRVKINGTWTNLTYNSTTGKYEGTIAAPSTTSYNLSGRYYPVTVEATNDAGTVTTKDDTDAAIGTSLRLTVKETVKPVITLISPTDGAYIQNGSAPIVFTVTDEANGSGVKESSIVLEVDDSAVPLTKTAIANGYQCTYTPETSMSDGSHAIVINAQDNDGNAAMAVDASYIIDTIPPTLTLSEPTSAVTNQPACTVAGITNDNLSTPVSVEISLNGVSAGSAAVDSSGNFSKTLTLTEGDNTIKVVSTDKSGRSTTVTKTVKLDTSIPQITNVSFAPNPVSTSQPVKITLEVM